MSKRRIKKAILAEALRICRDHQFPVKSFAINVGTGKVGRLTLDHPHGFMTELAHLVAKLDG
jgi:hypothetical protein